jgi:hypothetical protein
VAARVLAARQRRDAEKPLAAKQRAAQQRRGKAQQAVEKAVASLRPAAAR